MTTKENKRRRGAPPGNKNAAKPGRHRERVAVSFSGDLLDGIYDCLALDGEIVEDNDAERIREIVYTVVGGYVRRRKEQAGASDDGAVIL